jgi:hypothetical protein
LNRRTLTLAALLTVLASASGSCAYSVRQSSVPAHLRTIAVPVFENGTAEPNLDRDLTEAVIQRFIQNNALKVVGEEQAASVLRGRITLYTNSVFGFTDAKRANEYRVTISLSVTYKDVVKNREVWKDENLVKTAVYNVTDAPDQPARTETDGKLEAITKIADEILARTVENW